MRRAAWICTVALLTGHPAGVARAQSLSAARETGETLRPFAVGVVKTRIFQDWTGYGIYLGRGLVITAAHVVGRWPSLTHPRIGAGGQEFAAAVLKQGSLEGEDLALLSVDQAKLPMNLALRRTHLCREPPRVGESVIIVDLKGAARSQVLPPRVVPIPYRTKFGTVVAEVPVVGQSGSGVFRAQRNCLLGIISRAIRRPTYQHESVGMVRRVVTVAKYFVPAATIAAFIPAELRF